MSCGCKKFCETHGRDEIAIDSSGDEFCNECALDGWNAELCTPDPTGCHHITPDANTWEREFMCERHAAIHVKTCEEELGVEVDRG